MAGTDDDPVPAAGTSAWYRREGELPGRRWKVRCLFSDDHPDGTVVDSTVVDSTVVDSTVVDDAGGTDGLFQIWQADLDDQGRPRVLVNPDAVPGAPAMWFVSLPEVNVPRPAMTLVGFEADMVPAGSVINDATFFHLPVSNDDQVGAIRWWNEEAVVDQVFVSDRYRRRHVASALIYAASAYHQLHGWPGRLHSDGRRTSMGEQLVAGLRHPDRIAPLSDLMPPMDPTDPEDRGGPSR